MRIVDPACGSGVFLVTAFDFLKAELARVNDKIAALSGDHLGDLLDPDSEILTHNLYGVDVNAESVEIAKLSLWIKTAKKGKALDSLDKNLLVGDSLIEDSNFAHLSHGFSWQTAFPEIFAAGGFDVVLGNPPYVRQELLSPLKPYLENRFEVYHGVADLYCYFFERGLRLLKPGGRIGYISSSTFFKTNSGKPLREYLAKNATLEHVVDFGDHQIFEGVTTYPAILTMVNHTPKKDHQISFWTIDDMPKTNFRATYKTKAQTYPQHHLDGQSWELEDPRLKALRDKIRKDKPTLKEVYGSPLYGIKTGRNEAFVIDRTTRDRLVAEDPNSAEILKPWLEGKDLKRWRAESRDRFLILFPKSWTKTQFGELPEGEAWLRLSKLHPAISRQLAPFAEVCRKRTDKGDYWWELRACDYYDSFDRPKVLYRDIADSPPFQLDKSASLTANTCYFMPTNEHHLVAFLNSMPLWFVYIHMSSQIRGGFVRFFSQFVEKLPIPPTNDAQKQQLAILAEQCQAAAEQRYQLQQGVRRRIPDLCPPEREAKLNNKLKSWWEFPNFAAFRTEIKKTFKADIPLADRSDWEDWLNKDKADIARLSGEIKQHETAINKLVYDLFDLTPDEIELLEANI
ncbi:N-6 DNA methylase [Maritalea porphyrae]|nr:N-6 DNA methylase [Maritalea porphyrae]MCZ4271495.1 N-6 DNA methylase [Maritalea porphyrae]